MAPEPSVETSPKNPKRRADFPEKEERATKNRSRSLKIVGDCWQTLKNSPDSREIGAGTEPSKKEER